MRLLGIGLMLIAAMALVAVAEERKPPYEAVTVSDSDVESNGVYVRSGPGPKYYPTSMLKAGDRVTVHRHDPGGWFMIAPPRGSFSWIPGQYVERIDATRGRVTANNVVVRVGSFESDIRDLYQRRLAKGDEVQILGEKMLAGEKGGQELWFKIDPPRGEWRWIMGKYVRPVGAAAQTPAGPGGSDPFDQPVATNRKVRSKPISDSLATGDAEPAGDEELPRQPAKKYDPNTPRIPDDDAGPADGNGLVERPMVRSEGKRGKMDPDKRAALKDTQWEEELDRLDARFRAIIEKDTFEWDFNQLEKDYQRLGDAATHAAFERIIDTRLQAIDKYRKIQADYIELRDLTSETARRDAELAAEQRRLEEQASIRRTTSRFDGAGIIEHSAANPQGAPRYALMAPNGRVLAYLIAGPGVNLEQWVGISAGINGKRSYQKDLLADVIVVNKLTSVRLSQ